MTNVMTLGNMSFAELTHNELMAIDGGVDWDRIATGAAIFGGTLIAIAALPATLTVGAAVAATAGVMIASSAAGYYIGTGLAR